jgi:hypothetical protein
VDFEARRELELLEAVDRNRQVTQRGLASDLGIALGLANIYVRRLVRKGYIKCVNVQRNRVLYLITPKGIAEKVRLTYEFMEHSLRLYRQARLHLREVLAPLAANDHHRVVIFGTGEPAEVAYISLKELGIEPVGVLEDGPGGHRFLGLPVRPLTEHESVEFDLLIVATLEDPAALVAKLRDAGVRPEKLVTLRGNGGPPAAPAPSARAQAGRKASSR